MSKFIDISGKKFGRLTAISFAYRKGKDYYWLFKCDCGKDKIIRKNSVISGRVVSCGCYHNEMTGLINKKHCMKGTRLYHCWDGMKQRCYNKNCSNYKRYGGRGIKVCDEWRDNFKPFMEWAINNGYKDDLTIDRIDVNGNYTPANCRWATAKEQVRNRRNNVWITYKGETKLLVDWLKFFGKSGCSRRRIEKLGYQKIFDLWSS